MLHKLIEQRVQSAVAAVLPDANAVISGRLSVSFSPNGRHAASLRAKDGGLELESWTFTGLQAQSGSVPTVRLRELGWLEGEGLLGVHEPIEGFGRPPA